MTTARLARFLLLAVFTITLPLSLKAQVLYEGNQYLPPWGGFSGSDFDTNSLQNGNLHLRIPVASYKQRGGSTVSLFFVYDTPKWTRQTTITTSNGQRIYITSISGPFTDWGLMSNVFGTWEASSSISTTTCAGNQVNVYNSWVLTDPELHKHALDLATGGCGTPTTQSPTMDGSGMMVNIGSTPPMLTLKDGTQIVLSKSSPYVFLGSSQEDTNGNLINATDTLGRNLVTTTQGPTTTLTSPLGYQRNTTSYTLYTVQDSNGSSQTYRVDYALTDLATHFCGSLNNPPIYVCTDVSPGQYSTLVVPGKLTLPDGQTYQFSWTNQTPGELGSVILPTGGSISYTYGSGCTHQPVYTGSNYNGTTVPYDCKAGVGSRTVSVNSVNSIWNYSADSSGHPKLTDPNGNDQIHVFSYVSASSYLSPSTVETQVSYYQGSSSTGKLLKQITTDYTGEANGCIPECMVVNVRPIRVTTTLDNGLVTKTETDYETFTTNGILATRLNPTEKREYAYGSGAPGALLRRTDYTYLHNNKPTYATLNIVDRPASVTVYDGSGNTAAQTTYEYDVYNHSGMPTMGTSGAVQHDSLRSTTYTTRGNRTGTSRWRNTDGAWLTTLNQYDDAGNIIASKDPIGNLTQFDYTDSWISIAGTTGGSACAPSGQGKAFLTKVTNALSQITTHTYYSCTSALGSTTDPNNLTAWYVYDLFGRTVQAHAPDGGVTTDCFTDTGGTGCQQTAPPFQRLTTKSITASVNEVSTAVSDGLGRVTQTQLNSDPQGTVYSDTTYDLLSRVATVSNPYRAGSDPTSSPGTTTYTYDAISRKTAVTYPDNSVQQTAYCGNSTLATDPTGRWRRSLSDALGRLVEVDEPNAVGATVASTGCVGTGEPIWITSYSYDALGNLTQILQNGSHQRNFTHNSLSQLLTSANPEVGTITYTYDADGNVATKKDARNITTTYGYDALNRLKTSSYSNGDPIITTTYDQTACLGLTSCQNIGQRTSATDAAGSEAWSYQVDAANHRNVHADQRTTNGITKTVTYFLDLAGNVTQAVYPTGRAVNYTYDAADRPSKAADGSNGITYANDFETPPTGCLASAVCYTPQGTFYALSIGQSSSFTGLNLTHSYNDRLEPLEFKASSSGGNAIDITYSFVDSSNSHNAGHVSSITNNLDTTRSQTFSYDQLNRISSALTTSTYSTSPTHCWGETYSLDAWANLQSISATTNSQYTGCSQESGFSKTADGNNHLSGLSYDLSGNTSSDGVNSYTWDAESQLKTAAGATYTYDGDGRRVSKVGSKLYWYGAGGDILAETDSSGNTTAEYIFFGGKRLAMLPAGGNPIYYVEDVLGSSRVIAQNNGVVCYDADFYPYGGERSYTNTCPQNYKFEGKERDTETGNDDFDARYYSNRFGRWLSADWSAIPEPVPYANLTNPQTLNLYAMVADDPESFADLDGHDPQQGSAPSSNPPEICPNANGGGPCSGTQPDTRPTGTNNQAAQAQNQQKPKPETVVVVTSDTTHPVIAPGAGTTVTEREVVYTVEQKQGDTFTRSPGDHEISLQEVQTAGNEKPGICTPCKATNQIDDGMHVGGPGKTHTVQKEFYVDGKRTPVYGPAWRDKNGKPIPVMKLEARATDKKVDLVPVQ